MAKIMDVVRLFGTRECIYAFLELNYHWYGRKINFRYFPLYLYCKQNEVPPIL